MEKENLKEIYLAGGCFWGTEHYFKQIDGVVDTEVGYANGTTENPTYKDVCTDKTGFAETVHVTYNPDKVSLKFLLEMFFKAIDPTSINRQGHDTGTQYRTGVYYTDSTDEATISKVCAKVAAQPTASITKIAEKRDVTCVNLFVILFIIIKCLNCF